MSATGRSDVRRSDDFYATPAWCTLALLPHLTRCSVLDPCAGDGAILDTVRQAWGCEAIGIEVDKDRADRSRSVWRNALTHEPWPYADQIITNPPYSLASEFVERAITTGRDCAFLLRLNYLGSKKRAKFHREHPCDVYVLPRRPSFTNGGTDATEYAWMVWGHGRGNRWAILDVDTPDRARKLQQVDLRQLSVPESWLAMR